MSTLRFTTNSSTGYDIFDLRREQPTGVAGPHSRQSDLDDIALGAEQSNIIEWHAAYQNCQRHFLDYAQHDEDVQAVAALMNICLPFQRTDGPAINSTRHLFRLDNSMPYNLPFPSPWPVTNSRSQAAPVWVSLVPYIRRLVVTGMDREEVMQSFFGNGWKKGVGPMHTCERHNFMFTAKSVGWAEVRCQYDMSPHESVPFLKPLQNVSDTEIESAEKMWSRWLAMEDWMLGPRAPDW